MACLVTPTALSCALSENFVILFPEAAVVWWSAWLKFCKCLVSDPILPSTGWPSNPSFFYPVASYNLSCFICARITPYHEVYLCSLEVLTMLFSKFEVLHLLASTGFWMTWFCFLNPSVSLLRDLIWSHSLTSLMIGGRVATMFPHIPEFNERLSGFLVHFRACFCLLPSENAYVYEGQAQMYQSCCTWVFPTYHPWNPDWVRTCSTSVQSRCEPSFSFLVTGPLSVGVFHLL